MVMGIFVTACSGSDDDSGDIKNEEKVIHKAKFTVKIEGEVESSDFISFVFASADIKENTLWKINGVEQTNEMGVSLGDNEFSGGTTTYVVENAVPLQAISVGVQVLNFGAPLKVSYKAEIEGEVLQDVSALELIAEEDFTKQYSYSPE
ncbi:hypothetical protein ED312_15935 [Sinomicrobium pectinilyticum]|uniref:Uncharacterized protein n=2 Tax=Sinomicrobium pectinilyticum TaxID=1084421 RepID=A0A3N0E4X6_SINP1|nr:hypothetical protein ED312_15935 [Sinomicrobium pectinilyticum]